MNWYIEVLKKYVAFGGRAHRTEYWMFTLFNVLVAVAIGTVDGVIGGGGALGGLYSLGVLLPSIGVAIRRLHDSDRSGWWMLIALIPVLGVIVLIVFLVLEGTSGSNQYGPDPNAVEA